MRKVQVFKWSGGTPDREKIPDRSGFFHRWAEEYEECQDGIGQSTVAIVEFLDGRVGTFLPHMIQFLELPSDA